MPQKHSRNAKGGRRGDSTPPKTPNEYLATGVDLEEAGEKWRAGDTAKSTRFFLRALETYRAGRELYPHSFDLAYNSARLQYELTQQPRLLIHLSTPLTVLLELALDAHRSALAIDHENADLLFNSAQVLISLAETAIESRNIRDDTQSQILHLFQEGLELLQRCLGIQEIQLKKAEEQSHASQDIGQLADNEDANMIDRPEAVESVEDNWASIVEPVTTDTIVDNIVAQLETLTAICSLLGTQGHSVPDWVEQCYNNIHQAKVVDHSENGNEVALAAVKFKCAFFDTRFRSGNLDIQVYERELSNAFQQDLDILNNPQGLCDRADAELALNASLQASTNGSQQSPLPDFARLNNTRWKHITKALDCLTTASKLPQTQNLSRIQLRRGDCELLRLRLGQAPYYYDLAVQSTSSLTRNAEIYYRAAAAVAKMEDTSDEEREASIKEAIVMSLTKSAQQFKSLLAVSQTAIRETVEEMEEEGLLSGEAIDSINGLVAGE